MLTAIKYGSSCPFFCTVVEITAIVLPRWDPSVVTSGPFLYAPLYRDAAAGDKIEHAIRSRGDLLLLEQARSQSDDAELIIEDGWVHFLHGWTRVISEVFDIDIPTSGPIFDRLSDVARQARSARKEEA